MEVDEPGKAVLKKVPIVREGKIKRTQLPLVPPSHVKKGCGSINFYFYGEQYYEIGIKNLKF